MSQTSHQPDGQFIPTDIGEGTSVGNSYLGAFNNCPRKWFNQVFRPVLGDDGKPVGRGLWPHLRAVPLLKGGIFHEGLSSLYLSGCRDGEDTGEWNIDHAIDHMRGQWEKAKHEFEDETTAETEWTSCATMLRSYVDEYGPGAPGRDWPKITVAHDTKGQPIVERDFKLQLSSRYVYTCRSDLLVFHDGYLKTMEHKTSAAGFVKQRLNSGAYDPQFSGEIACMVAHLGQLFGPEPPPFHGVLLNVIVKDRSLRSKFQVAERKTTTRTPPQLERWRQQTLHTLDRIEHSIQQFELELSNLGDVDKAADIAFPTLGTHTDHCFAYYRECDYFELCSLPGLEQNQMRRFRVRSPEEVTSFRKWNR